MYQEYLALSGDLRAQGKLISSHELQPTSAFLQRAIRIPAIDRELFSRSLAAWILPSGIVAAAERLERDPDYAHRQSELVVGSPVLEHASDGGLKGLVTDFLECFSLSEDLIRVTRAYCADAFEEATWELLASLRFDGEIVDWTPQREIPSTWPEEQRCVLVVRASDALTDLLSHPLAALAAIVSKCAATWKLARIHFTDAYLTHSVDGPLFVHIESRVARALGYEDVARAGRVAESGFSFRYRAVTLIGTPPYGPVDIEAARHGARSEAASTFDPIP